MKHQQATTPHRGSRIYMADLPPKPQWQEQIDWRPGRWDPMFNAPRTGYPIRHVRGREADGRIVEPMHFAQGGGEEQPPFVGWFIPSPGGFDQCFPVEWQPLHASPTGDDGKDDLQRLGVRS